MDKLTTLVKDYPEYTFTSQFCLADGEWNTIISFHNYYDQIFRTSGIETMLVAMYHDENGYDLHYHEQIVPPGRSTQIDAKALGIKKSGIVAVAAIALADLKELSKNKLNLKSKITTGFYINWEFAHRYRDMMHEWEYIAEKNPVISTHHIGLKASKTIDEQGLIITNPNLVNPIQNKDIMILRNAERGEEIARASLPTLPAMGGRLMRYSEYFPEINNIIHEHNRLVVDLVTSQNAPPLTVEWHKSGDFHIHHL